MADFVSWATELTRAKNALANRTWDAYFVASVENSREMRTTYTKLGNVHAFIEWLERRAAEEALGAETGTIFTAIGGNF